VDRPVSLLTLLAAVCARLTLLTLLRALSITDGATVACCSPYKKGLGNQNRMERVEEDNPKTLGREGGLEFVTPLATP
jgi:hypothetical protein